MKKTNSSFSFLSTLLLTGSFFVQASSPSQVAEIGKNDSILNGSQRRERIEENNSKSQNQQSEIQLIVSEEPLSFQGKYITINNDGIISIKQPRYPLHKTSQSLMPPTRQTGPAQIYYYPDGTSAAMVPCVPYEEGQILDPLPLETKLTGEAYDIVTKEDSTKMPHFSCGRLKMHFEGLPKGQDYFCGSAAAIDKNLLITAAHNFFPSHLSGNALNNQKLRAQTVNFEHLLIDENDRRGRHHIHVASHCYMHPEWEKNFNPHYDIALVFLSECITLTEKEHEALLKLQVLSESVKGSIRIVGYPGTYPVMRASTGTLEDGEDASKIIYHRANTEGRSSGSPIIKDNKTIVGIHAYGTLGGIISPSHHNSGVRIRHDLLSFFEESIRLNQMLLEDEEKALSEKTKIQQRYEAEQAEKHKQEGIMQGKKEGKIEGKIEILIDDGLTNEQILQKLQLKHPDLTVQQIETIRQG